MSIQQLNLSYDQVQDRLLFRVGLSDHTEIALWLTYRFARELWAALNNEAHLPASEAFNTTAVSSATQQFRHEMAASEALAKMDFETAYQSRESLRDDGVMLATGFKLSNDVKHLDIECLENLMVNINLTSELVLAMCNMLQLVAKEAGWDMKVDLPAIVLNEPSAPKVLH